MSQPSASPRLGRQARTILALVVCFLLASGVGFLVIHATSSRAWGAFCFLGCYFVTLIAYMLIAARLSSRR